MAAADNGNDTFKNNTSIPAKAYGGNGNDRLYGGAGNDELHGEDGNDILYGNNGDDFLYGGAGDDILIGGAGNDIAQGDEGNDELWGNAGNDVLRGGDGDDRLDGGDGNDTLYGDDGDDRLSGGNHNDVLYGLNGNDLLEGDAGDDRLYGGAGLDWLYGGSGNDSLFGGADSEPDSLDGGRGNDRFLVIADDERSTLDVIVDGKGIEDKKGEDARINFVNGQSKQWPGLYTAWTDKEVAVIDQAFAQLFGARRDNALLKDSQSVQPLSFYKDYFVPDAQGFQTVGVNYSPYDSFGRAIVIGDWDETESAQSARVVSTVIHEVAHNFDLNSMGAPATDAHLWRSFTSISGWVQNPSNTRRLFVGQWFGTTQQDSNGWYRSSNNAQEFAASYGGMNPREDWATTWELYFKQGCSTAAKNAKLAAKLKIVDRVVRNL